jgi:hypothetical protein
MNSAELEFYSTRELIDELLRRTSFQGVIVHAREGAKSPSWEGERIFSVRHSSNLETEQAGRLLDAVSQYIAGTI